ncbi:MAG: hypothetical protein KTR31_19835 [Myxococcales bacterium]|nr:hypothetical protein [Myxococcales bacterium]
MRAAAVVGVLAACAPSPEAALRDVEGAWTLGLQIFEQGPDAANEPCRELFVDYVFESDGTFTRRQQDTTTGRCDRNEVVTTTEAEGTYVTFVLSNDLERYISLFHERTHVVEEIAGEVGEDRTELDAFTVSDSWTAGSDDDGPFLVLFEEGVFRTNEE